MSVFRSIDNQAGVIRQLSWSSTDKGTFIERTSASSIMYVGAKENDVASLIRTSESIPESAQSFYFEMRITNRGKDGAIGIGLATRDAKTNQMPGWSEGTIGYHGDDGGIFHATGSVLEKAETFTTNDIVSCQVKRVQVDKESFCNVIQFGKNGKTVGPQMYMMNEGLHPVIGIHTPGAKVETNLGEDAFAYQLTGTIMIHAYY